MSTSTYKFRRTADRTGYVVERVTQTVAVKFGEVLGTVARDGNAWVIVTTARGDLPGEPARYATRVDAVDALSAMLKRAAELDAQPTDEPAVLAELDAAVAALPADVAPARVVRPGDAEPSCASCGYFTGHTSWCPRRHAEQPAEQTTLVIETNPGAPVHTVGNYVDPTPDAEVDRTTPVAELDDRGLWLQFMLEDREMGYGVPDDDRHGALIAEIGRRFGNDATELTADWSVALHMSSDDLIGWARDEYEHLIGVATGRILPSWRREDGFGVELTHGGCADCERFIDAAVGIARATGSVGATYGTAGSGGGQHAATVTRDPAQVGG